MNWLLYVRNVVWNWQVGTYTDLTDNIDLLRKRVGMPTLTSVKPTVEDYWPDYGYPVSDELAIIRQERRVELAGGNLY